MLEDAKRHCDYLIVGLHTDPSTDRSYKRKPFQTIVERQIQLAAIKYVDEIVVYETESDLLEVLNTRHIDVAILGSDYIGKDFTGKSLYEAKDISVYYHPREHGYSSTALVKKIQAAKTAK
jgi:glycerol-3-phosphate cytidylyltransferase